MYTNGQESDWVGGTGGSIEEVSFGSNEIFTVEVRTGDNVDGIRFYGEQKYDSGILGTNGGTSIKYKADDGDKFVGFFGYITGSVVTNIEPIFYSDLYEFENDD
jgi:hypothetical protein